MVILFDFCCGSGSIFLRSIDYKLNPPASYVGSKNRLSAQILERMGIYVTNINPNTDTNADTNANTSVDPNITPIKQQHGFQHTKPSKIIAVDSGPWATAWGFLVKKDLCLQVSTRVFSWIVEKDTDVWEKCWNLFRDTDDEDLFASYQNDPTNKSITEKCVAWTSAFVWLQAKCWRNFPIYRGCGSRSLQKAHNPKEPWKGRRIVTTKGVASKLNELAKVDWPDIMIVKAKIEEFTPFYLAKLGFMSMSDWNDDILIYIDPPYQNSFRFYKDVLKQSDLASAICKWIPLSKSICISEGERLNQLFEKDINLSDTHLLGSYNVGYYSKLRTLTRSKQEFITIISKRKGKKRRIDTAFVS